MKILLPIFAPLLLAALVAHSPGAPGGPDPSFGTAGVVSVLPATGSGGAWSVAVQSDGKVVAAGDTTAGSGDFAVMRFLTGGGLDPSFGTAGLVTASAGLFDSTGGVVLQPDGKIVLAGCGLINGGTRDIVVFRFLTSGVPDAQFGDGGKKIISPLETYNESISCVALDAGGGIYAAGLGKLGFVVARFLANGQPDGGFGTQGIVQTQILRGGAQAKAIAVQPDGRIVVAGLYRLANNVAAPVVVRYLQNGPLDPSFGSGGIATVDQAGQFTSLALHGDGHLLVGGSLGSLAQDFLLLQLWPDGSLDQLFGSGGFVTLDTGGNDSIGSIALTNSGKIVFAGETTQGGTTYAATLRLRSNGALDTAFGTGGATYSSFGTEDRFRAVAIHTDGKVVAAGCSRQTDGNTRFAVTRLLADTSLHPLESWRITHFGTAANSGIGSDAADPDGDGVGNLLEYAFGLDPRNRASRNIPVPALLNGALSVLLPSIDASKGLLYGAQTSTDMTAGSWQFLNAETSPAGVRYTAPAGGARRWMRLYVTLNP